MDMLGIVNQRNVYDRCRTCMTTIGNASFNIFEHNIQNISIAEILHSFTAITFNENDTLPKVVCQQCYEKLNSFYEFIINIENVDTKFKEVHKEEGHLPFERDLKNNFDFQEVTVEYTLKGNEGRYIKEENSEEENSALCTEDNIFVGSGDKVELISPCSLKYETEQEYLCKLCNKNFRNEKNYQRHNKKHLTFTINNSNLSKGEKQIVISNEGFICEHCKYSFNSEDALSTHFETCTNKITSYENYSHLDNLYDYKTDSNEIEINPPEHNKNSKQIDPEEIKEENEIKCHNCSLVFKSQISLSVHKQRNEDCNESNFINYQNEYTEENHLGTTEKEGLIACEICHRRFRNKYSMSAHMRKHVEKGRILACPTCGKVFTKVNHLKRHRFLLHRDCNDASTHFQSKDTKDISTATEEGEFICKICKRRFKTKHSMSAHMRKHVEKSRTLSLSTSSRIFSKVNHLSPHQLLLLKDCNESKTNCQSKEANENILTGTEEGEFICDICKIRFNNRYSMSAHMQKHVEQGRVLSCSTCSKVFSKVSYLKRHQDNCPSEEGESTNCQSEDAKVISTGTEEGEYICEICRKGFKKKHSMSAHMRKHVEKGRVLSCSTCSKVFRKVSHLKRHEITHEDKRHFKCGICKKPYSTEELLQQHSKQHKDAKTCPVCQKAFTNMPALNTHIKVHTRSKLYLCSYCGKRFDSSTNLNQHYKRHIGIKTFACSLCPRKFVTKGELTSHASTHTGEKPHKCKQCNASFTKNSSLVKHTHRHLGIKPYQCDKCSKKFTTNGSLKLHYRIHTGEKPYSCDICARAFAQSNDLVKHRRRHLGEKLYKCEQCTESFRLKTELKHHISQHYITQLQETNMAAKHIDIIEINIMEEKSSI